MSYIENRIKSFYKKFDKKDSGCWEWSAQLNRDGYGRHGWNDVNGKGHVAHRFSAKYIKGLNIDGLVVCHHCDNPSCVNPDHLFVGTQQDNIKDRHSKGRSNAGNKIKVKTPLGIFSSMRQAAFAHKIDPSTIYSRFEQNWPGYIKI